jgi:PIN domain nuclease of toxin-antitoxin system
MTVLDAYAVIAYLRDEPAADEVARLLAQPTVLASVNAAEVMDQMVRVWRHDPDHVEVTLAMLTRAGLVIRPAGPEIAIRAGLLRARHYDPKTCSVSMADCIAAATALDSTSALATSDPHLAQLMGAEDGLVHRLPDGRGA